MTVRRLLAAEFDALLDRDYPRHFLDASHLLLRAVRGEDMFDLGKRRRALLMRLFLESRALRVVLPGQARGRATRRPDAKRASEQRTDYDVVGLYLPDRPDYAVLLAPALQALQRSGHRACVLAENAQSVDQRLFPGLDIIDLEHWTTFKTYTLARETHVQLAGARARLADEFELRDRERQTVELIFQAQAWQQHAFTAALDELQPRVVYGLHLTMFPGITAALRERRASGVPISTILIQHGVFSRSWEEHDFRGADLVLTWGDYFTEELSSFPVPLPRVAAVGHPRLEALRLARDSTAMNETAAAVDVPRLHRVIYLGTNGVEADDIAAVQLVADAFQRDETLDLRFLPHPNEPLSKYDRLVADGRIVPAQVVTGASTYQEVLAADLVLGTQTTMLPESLALGIPVIQVLPERFAVDWQRWGMATASDAETLRRVALSVVSDVEAKRRLLENTRALVEQMFGDTLGVTDRVIEQVEAEIHRVRAA